MTDNRNRLHLASQRDADPDSLIGSFFHGTGKFTGRQGCVVAQPHPGIYLVEFFSWLAGDSTHQQLVPIADMIDWRFYDDAEWMNNTYNHGDIRRFWDQEKSDSEGQS